MSSDTIVANVTAMFRNREPWDCSNNVATLGDQCARLTWQCALKADGVATIVDPILYGSTWLRIEFQEYKSGPPVEHCEANIQLTDTPAQIPGAARMLAQLQARMDRRNRHHRWHSFAIALLAADRLCDMRVEQYRYRTRDGYERFEYVVRKPVAAQAVAV